jgi:hypothetical protein
VRLDHLLSGKWVDAFGRPHLSAVVDDRARCSCGALVVLMFRVGRRGVSPLRAGRGSVAQSVRAPS